MFDEIHIDSLGNTTGSPFQVQIRKRLRDTQGNRRNLIDVGYGVSQALPVITELLNPEPPPLFLLQQPEVHLHPSAQASLVACFAPSQAGTVSWSLKRTAISYLIGFSWTSETRKQTLLQTMFPFSTLNRMTWMLPSTHYGLTTGLRLSIHPTVIAGSSWTNFAVPLAYRCALLWTPM